MSVRVFSPGEDAPNAESRPVVSGAEPPDITAGTVPSSELPDESADEPVQGSNTNVTVRILSPGNNGPVDQGSPLGAESAADEPAENPAAEILGEGETSDEAERDGAQEAGNDSSTPLNDDAQYQGGDSRYQSQEQFAERAWIWNWGFIR